jgi:hypothetical protein
MSTKPERTGSESASGFSRNIRADVPQAFANILGRQCSDTGRQLSRIRIKAYATRGTNWSNLGGINDIAGKMLNT